MRRNGGTLLLLLDKCFKDDPLIDEIGLLPGKELDGETLVLEGHKLGIPRWWGPIVFPHAFNILKEKHTKIDFPSKIENSTEDKASIPKLISSTRAILIFNADYHMAWTQRKRMMLQCPNDQRNRLLLSEINFLDILCTLHPKSMESWSHRGWVFRLLCSSKFLDPQLILKNELVSCTKAAGMYRRNYYAWTHRLRVCKLAASHKCIGLLKMELDALVSYMRQHISDHTAWNHRLAVILELSREIASPCQVTGSDSNSALCSLWQQEFGLLDELMSNYPGHEAMWCHRRNLVSTWLDHVCLQKCTSTSQKQVHDLLSSSCLSYPSIVAMTASELRQKMRSLLKGMRGEMKKIIAKEMTFYGKCCSESHLGIEPSSGISERRYTKLYLGFLIVQAAGKKYL